MTITYNCDKCGADCRSISGAEVSPEKGTINKGRYHFNINVNSFQLCNGCAFATRKYLKTQPTDTEVRAYLEEVEKYKPKPRGLRL